MILFALGHVLRIAGALLGVCLLVGIFIFFANVYWAIMQWVFA